jgi:hypothetical protein
MTHEMLVVVQCLLCYGRPTPEWEQRLTRIEDYLIRRMCR